MWLEKNFVQGSNSAKKKTFFFHFSNSAWGFFENDVIQNWKEIVGKQEACTAINLTDM